MGTLSELVNDPSKRQQLIDEALSVVDAEVGDKGGLGGMAIKAAYAMAKGVAPGIMRKILDTLAPEFLMALEPFYEDAKSRGQGFKALLASKSNQAANALLAVTDQRARKESGGALKKGYEKLRPSAEKHVEAALPRLADMITKIAG